MLQWQLAKVGGLSGFGEGVKTFAFRAQQREQC
jgi:hypothetical protein